MPNERICPECERPLSPEALAGVCPVCSLKNALRPKEAPSAAIACAPPAAEDSPSASPSPFVIKNFGDYTLLEMIARGGMGVVYKARQRSLDRIVALKMLMFGPEASPEFARRFRAEAVAAASLQHPNIVAIHEVGVHQDQHFYVMDYVAGPSLAQLAGHQPLPARRAAKYLKTIAEAIHYAHERGILHRDLKPSNVLIDEHDQPRVTDFGLAKRFESDSQVTLSGQVLGSPSYIPPEQALGKRIKVTRQSDVYALGAMLYHLLTGRPPFQGESLADTLQQVLNTEPVAPRTLHPNVPRDLETICLKCLEKEPHRRYPTAQALAEDLERFLGDQPVLARPLGPVGKSWRWCRRRPVLAGLSATLVLTFVLGLAGVLLQWRRAESARTAAETNASYALRLAYAGDMNRVQQAIEGGDLGSAREYLDSYRPGHGVSSALQSPRAAVDLRGWEWRYLWGLCQSDEKSTFAQHSNALAGIAFLPGGKELALLVAGRNVEVWDWDTRRKTGAFPNRGASSRMAVSPAGHLLATVDTDATNGTWITLCDLTTRREIGVIPQTHQVNSIAISPDGTVLATYHMAPLVRLWRLPSGEPLTNIPASDAINYDFRVAQFSPDGSILALGEGVSNSPQVGDGRIRLRHRRTGRETNTISPRQSTGVCALAFSPDGKILAAGYGFSDAVIRLWDAVSGASLGELIGHRGMVTHLIFAPDGLLLYSASADHTIRVWDVNQHRQVAWLNGHLDAFTGLALCPDGKFLVSSSGDGSVRVWDPDHKPHPPAYVVLPVQSARFGAPFTSDSRQLITASLTNSVIVWDVASTREVERIPDLGTNNMSIALSPDNRLVAVGNTGGVVKVWDRDSRRLVKQFIAYPLPIYWMGFLDQGKSLVTVCAIPHLRMETRRWSTVSWLEMPFPQMEEGWTLGVAQSPDKRLLAVGHFGRPLRLWDASGKSIALLPPPPAGFSSSFPVFSTNGQLLAAEVNGTGRVWDTTTLRELATLKPSANFIMSTGFSPDGRRLVSGGLTGGTLQPAVKIWDYTVQRDLISLWSKGDFTWCIQFSPDGNTVIALSWTGIAELWRAPSWAEIEARETKLKIP